MKLPLQEQPSRTRMHFSLELARVPFGVKVVKGLLSGGPHVISSYSCMTVEYYQSIFQSFGSRSSALEIASGRNERIKQFQSQVSFKDKTAYRNVSVSSDILVRNQLKVLVNY